MLFKAVWTRWVELLLGIGVCVLGINIFGNPTLDSWKYGRIGFGGYHHAVGVGIALLGLAALILIVRRIYIDYQSGKEAGRNLF
jgi:hypothetical protein